MQLTQDKNDEKNRNQIIYNKNENACQINVAYTKYCLTTQSRRPANINYKGRRNINPENNSYKMLKGYFDYIAKY